MFNIFRIVFKIFYNIKNLLKNIFKIYLFTNIFGHIIFLQNVEHNIYRFVIPYYKAINFVEIPNIFNAITALAYE